MTWDDFDEDVKENTTSGGTRCSVAKFLEQLPEEGRTVVQASLNNPNRQTSAIAKALRTKVEQMGLDLKPLSQENIGRHRRGECKCPRAAS